MARSRRVMVTIPLDLAERMDAAQISPSDATREGIRVLLGDSEQTAPRAEVAKLARSYSKLARELAQIRRRQALQEDALLGIARRL